MIYSLQDRCYDLQNQEIIPEADQIIFFIYSEIRKVDINHTVIIDAEDTDVIILSASSRGEIPVLAHFLHPRLFCRSDNNVTGCGTFSQPILQTSTAAKKYSGHPKDSGHPKTIPDTQKQFRTPKNNSGHPKTIPDTKTSGHPKHSGHPTNLTLALYALLTPIPHH